MCKSGMQIKELPTLTTLLSQIPVSYLRVDIVPSIGTASGAVHGVFMGLSHT